MKTRLPAERLREKTAETLVTNHLRRRYQFSPVVAEALSDDLQLLQHQVSGSSQLSEGQILYPAVKTEEPAGKALKDCHYEMVRLTMYARSDLRFQQKHGLKALKQRILQRITEEAEVQGAPLTYEDLGRLLFADRKTISGYIQELLGKGQDIVTRATYTDASASISHHRPIVKQFLLNYTEPEIAQRLNHSLGQVEGYIKDFLREIQQNDLVIGSRYISGVNVINWPMTRLMLSYFANMYSRIITGMPIRDATGGFKCFRRKVLEALPLERIKSDGYSFQIEMNVHCWKRKFSIKEIPILFVDRQVGISKMSKRIIWEAMWMVWALRFRRIP